MTSSELILDHPTPPSLSHVLSEFPRAGAEVARLLVSMPRLIKKAHPGDGHPVLTLPGYGAGDGAMGLIRHYLNKIGYQAHPLKLGVNFDTAEDSIHRIEEAAAFRRKMSGLVVERIKEIYQSERKKVSLVGWSMGGIYAFDASQEVPQLTRSVITLGAPYGDPRSTSLYKLLNRVKGTDIPMEEQDFGVWLKLRRIKTDAVPIKVVYSEKDGIVPSSAARLKNHPCVEYIEVDSSHIGFASNPKVYKVIQRLLALT
jgi:pimeloyl-ACP methyl ester carboxylesterase